MIEKTNQIECLPLRKEFNTIQKLIKIKKNLSNDSLPIMNKTVKQKVEMKHLQNVNLHQAQNYNRSTSSPKAQSVHSFNDLKQKSITDLSKITNLDLLFEFFASSEKWENFSFEALNELPKYKQYDIDIKKDSLKQIKQNVTSKK